MRLKSTICESTLSTVDAVPLPQWGRRRGGGFAAKKEKPTPPRCARQPLPREGARVVIPSFLWKEVPRRGGGWMGEVLSPTHSLPRVGKVASGASRIGFWRYEKERGDRLKCVVYESTLSTAARSPFPNGEGNETRIPLFSHRQSEYRIRGEKQYRRTKPSPRGEGGERSEPDRVLAV